MVKNHQDPYVASFEDAVIPGLSGIFIYYTYGASVYFVNSFLGLLFFILFYLFISSSLILIVKAMNPEIDDNSHGVPLSNSNTLEAEYVSWKSSLFPQQFLTHELNL